MTTYVAMLRAVNIGQHQRVGMAELRKFTEGLGYARVRTLLASGNLVFDGPLIPGPRVERRLEEGAERELGLRTPFLVRTAAEVADCIRHNPLPKAAAEDPGHLVVVFLRNEPAPAAWSSLAAAIRGPEVVRGWGKHAFIHYAGGIGTSRLTGAVIDRNLGTIGTGRNWNTVGKLAALAAG